MIQLDELNDSYYNFPYQARKGDTASDTTAPCIGGINLVDSPEKIDEIPETQYSTTLKKLLVDLNKADSPYSL
ncbi:hypothetical protein [Rodentibacter genomosp. 2]|uniref:hypothetical protein n=1 Tax=Rodentibacter genomosp. 2 TaxID=1908266 RepID=UPI001FC9B985